MKQLHKILVALLVLLGTSCDKNVLDKKPLSIISGDLVWNDESLVNAHLTGSYVATTVLCNDAVEYQVSSQPFFSIFYVNNVGDESKSTSNFSGNAYQYRTGGLKINGGLMEWWEKPYRIIRSLNEFIEELPESTLPETFKATRIAEARFLRAFNYFAMVKRYGGVPLITKVQQLSDDRDELYPKRSTEKEVYDFIIREAKEIAAILPQRQDAANFGRPDRNAALALVSRAALYAGSLAKYGEVQLNGVIGIPAGEATAYFQQSMAASDSIIVYGGYTLLDAGADKVTNFKNIFLTKMNSEVIFAKPHDGSDKDAGGAGWSYDYFQCPYPNGWANGIHDAPYLELVEAYENVDGSATKLTQANLDTKLWTMDELFGKKDPRFAATIYTEQTPWQGRKLAFHNGLIAEDGTLLTSGSYKGILTNGDQKPTQTGFGVMKYLDETKDNGNSSTAGIFGSKQDFIVFRLAEILLNYAEAAHELGLSQEPLNAINKIRTRAGILPLTTISMEAIRHERQVELAFEGHRYWDLRRWRTAVNLLSKNMRGLRYILDYNTRKYKLVIREKIDGANITPVFQQQNYYFPITLSRTSNNNNLVENPGYN